MPQNLTQKIIASHLARPCGLEPGREIYLTIDQTLTHDITAVMSYLAFEQLGLPRVRTQVSVSYLDHSLLYTDSRSPDDHRFLQSVARRFGIYLSRPGNGIMHSVHYARFGIPGRTSLGTDSHTTTGGAIGMLAIGAGGMDAAAAMAGLPLRLNMPQVVQVRLTGRLRPGCSAKDVILTLLRRLGVSGGVGKVLEYTGPGVSTLEVPQRGTIANMGAELGATSSLFPADGQVRRFFAAQEREEEFVPLEADPGCTYDGRIDIDLSALVPLIACPHQPDNVTTVERVEKKPVRQVFIGSCTNASYGDIAKAALVLQGRHVQEEVSCTCGVATRQIYKQLLRDGYLDMLVDAGVRLLEISCGPCCGIGQVPPTGGVSLRTSNRNFKGRGGSADALLYLASPETAAASAVTGTFTTAQELMGDEIDKLDQVREPERYFVDDSLLLPPLPLEQARQREIVRGPNIQPLPIPDPPAKRLRAAISLKAGDNVSTDDITPASAQLSGMRSNIPLLAQYAYSRYDPGFVSRAKELGQSIIIAGANYGQGSSREHAAITPMYLGVRGVIAKSMARIHKSNLINHGVVPMLFEDPEDYRRLAQGHELEIDPFREGLIQRRLLVRDVTGGFAFRVRLELSEEELQIILAGGLLRRLRDQCG